MLPNNDQAFFPFHKNNQAALWGLITTKLLPVVTTTAKLAMVEYSRFD
jgi:hypothetical protein